MTGTLELLCGPSGAGKSSSLGKKTKAYTYTTRPQRDGEIDGVDRRFVTESEFAILKQKGEILTDYKYGDFSYGFSKDIADAMQSGENISEQIVPYEGVVKVSNMFEKYGPVKKNLFLTNIAILGDKLLNRKVEDFISRSTMSKDTVRTYLSHLNEFDSVEYVPLQFYNSMKRMKKALLEDEKLLMEFSKDIKNHGAILDVPYLPLFALQKQDTAGMLFILNPNLYERTVQITGSIVEECLRESGLEIPNTLKTSKVIGKKIFEDLVGISSIFMELENISAAGELCIKTLVELQENKPFSNNLESDNVIVRQIAHDCIEKYGEKSLEKYSQEVWSANNFPQDIKNLMKRDDIKKSLPNIVKSHRLLSLSSEISSAYIYSTIIPDISKYLKKEVENESLEGLMSLNMVSGLMDMGYFSIAKKIFPLDICVKDFSSTSIANMNKIRDKNFDNTNNTYDLYVGIYAINEMINSSDRYLWAYNLGDPLNNNPRNIESKRIKFLYDLSISQTDKKNTIERKYLALAMKDLFNQLSFYEKIANKYPSVNRFSMNFPPTIDTIEDMRIYFFLHKNILLRKTQKQYMKSAKKDYDSFMKF